jgi:hypothetical protein
LARDVALPAFKVIAAPNLSRSPRHDCSP